MDRNEIFHHYSKILDKLIDRSNFFKIYFQGCYTLEDDMQITNALRLCTGVSRGCLVDDTYDYVIKFNLSDNDGACDREVDIYQDAIRNQVEEFFIPSMYLGTYTKIFEFYSLQDVNNTITWYDEDEFNSQFSMVEDSCELQTVTIVLHLFAYPRATTKCISSFSTYSEEDEEYVENSTSPLREYSLAIAAAFLSDYGTERYNQLTNFLYDWDINDIHPGNVGELNGHICIIDYAGV